MQLEEVEGCKIRMRTKAADDIAATLLSLEIGLISPILKKETAGIRICSRRAQSKQFI
jgi:hypothetical protein